jgi:hypothetical protein
LLLLASGHAIKIFLLGDFVASGFRVLAYFDGKNCS